MCLGVCVHACVHVCVEVSVNLRSHPPCVFEVGVSILMLSEWARLAVQQGPGILLSPLPQHKDNHVGTIPACTASTLTAESFCPDPHFPVSCQ